MKLLCTTFAATFALLSTSALAGTTTPIQPVNQQNQLMNQQKPLNQAIQAAPINRLPPKPTLLSVPKGSTGSEAKAALQANGMALKSNIDTLKADIASGKLDKAQIATANAQIAADQKQLSVNEKATENTGTESKSGSPGGWNTVSNREGGAGGGGKATNSQQNSKIPRNGPKTAALTAQSETVKLAPKPTLVPVSVKTAAVDLTADRMALKSSIDTLQVQIASGQLTAGQIKTANQQIKSDNSDLKIVDTAIKKIETQTGKVPVWTKLTNTNAGQPSFSPQQ